MILVVVFVFIINGLQRCEGCNVDEFECDNGNCININKWCDINFDCGGDDLSDEINCTLIRKCDEGTERCHGIGECVLKESCFTSEPAVVLTSLLHESSSLPSTSSTTYQIVETSSSSLPSTVFPTMILSETVQTIASLSSATTLPMETSYLSTESSSFLSNTMNLSSYVLPTTTMATISVIMTSTVMVDSSSTIPSNNIESIYGITSSVIETLSSTLTSSLVRELFISSTNNIIEASSVEETSPEMLLSSSSMVEETSSMFSSQIIESSYALSSNVIPTSFEMFSSRDMYMSTQSLSNKVESLNEPSTDIMVTYSTMYTSSLSMVESSNINKLSSDSVSTSIESFTSILSSSLIDSNSFLSSNIINTSSVSLSNVTATTSTTFTSIMNDPFSISSNLIESTIRPSRATSSAKLTSVSIREISTELLLSSSLSEVTIEPSPVFLTSDVIGIWSSKSSSAVLSTSNVEMSSVMPTSSMMGDSSSTNVIESSFSILSDVGGVSTAWLTSELSTVTKGSVATSSIISTFESTTLSTTPKAGEVPVDVNNNDMIILIAVLAAIVVIMIIVSLVGYQLMRRRRAVTLHRGNGEIDNDHRRPPLVYQNEFPHLDFVHARRSSIPRPQSYTRITHNELARHEEIELRPDYPNGHSQNDVQFY